MSAKPPVRLCSHLHPHLQPCRAVAVAGSAFCYHHRRTQQRLRRQQHTARIARRRESPTHLGPLTTRRAILRAISRVHQALSAGTIDSNLATALLFRLQRATYTLDQRQAMLLSQRNWLASLNLDPSTLDLEVALPPAPPYNHPNPTYAAPNEQRTTNNE